jgi:conjugative transfer pilus assembly protein TraH
MRNILKIILLTLMLISNAALASVDSDLGNFFNRLGYQNNVSSPAAYQGQAAGYYTGGSLYLRNQVKNYQIVSLEMPSFSGGCSGIDTYLGAFSVITGSQINQMMKSILSAGGAYAFDLALTTTVPQIKSVKDYIQKYVNDINSANINSCETGEDLVGGMWPKTQESQQQICRDIGSHSGALTDWASARQDCGTGGQFNQLMENAGHRGAEVIVNKNVVWNALQQNGFSSADNELSELLMSLSGTIIVRTGQDGNPKMIPLQSLASDRDLIKAILHGGQAEIYVCDEYKKCIRPTLKTITISDGHALINQVSNMISQLNVAVVSDTGTLQPSVRGFLEMTPIPILKFISNEAELGQPLDTTQYSEVIAISLLDQYFLENITLVKQALLSEDTPMNEKMSREITEAQTQISQNLNDAYKKLQNTMMLVNNMRVMEQQLASRLADRAAVGQQ